MFKSNPLLPEETAMVDGAIWAFSWMNFSKTQNTLRVHSFIVLGKIMSYMFSCLTPVLFTSAPISPFICYNISWYF
jgi:hypothetical protein